MDVTRSARDKGATKDFQMKTTSRLPAAKLLFSVTSNKIQVIVYIIADLIDHKDDEVTHSLIVTGPEYVPYELPGGVVIRRADLETTQEEADTIILQQDIKHPVTNLTRGDGFRKWLSHPQERSGQMEAIFQLEQPCIISYIDIGSIWCATLEVQVGRSDWPAGREFETLVYTFSVMSPTDCNLGKNTTSTQMFSSDLFCPEVGKREWDRIKVICRQPYKKMAQFGLSFIQVKSSGGAKTTTTTTDSGEVPVGPTMRSIQKHFFGKSNNGLTGGKAKLKDKLLKIAGSAENGTEHDGSLSRTARLVLAASGPRPNVYSPQTKAPGAEKAGMFSNCVEQKYGSTFLEEVEEFLAALKIDKAELDRITLADLRHQFERKKRRKLTKEEKGIFIKMATEFVQSLFDSDGETTSQTEEISKNSKLGAQATENYKPMTTATHNVTNVVNKKENVLNGERRQILSDGNKAGLKDKPLIASTNSVNENNIKGPNKRPGSIVKRKLNEDNLQTPPPKKMLTESSISMRRQLKSAEKLQSNKDIVNSIKRSRLDIPVPNTNDGCVTPSTAFEYKGLRGMEDVDLDISMSSPKPSTEFGVFAMSPSGITSPPTKLDSTSHKNIPVPWLAVVNADLDMLASCDTSTPKGRRGGKGRGRGRGRGRRKKKNDPDEDLYGFSSMFDNSGDLDLLPDFDAVCSPVGGGLMHDLDISSPVRGRGRKRGRGRGRGSGRGEAAKKHDISSPVPAPTDPPVYSPLRSAPRGFAKCAGCKEYFGEALLSNHQQKCVAWKTKQTGSATTTSESPWLTSRPAAQSTDAINRTSSTTSQKSSAIRSTDAINRTAGPVSTPGNKLVSKSIRSDSDNSVKSPPWLLAAERRLHKQNRSVSQTNSRSRTNITSTGSMSSNAFFDSDDSDEIPPIDYKGKNCVNQSNNTSTCNQSGGYLNRNNSIDLTADYESNNDDGDDNVYELNNNENEEPAHLLDDTTIQVECPLCAEFYPSCVIQVHASSCYL